jgi:hypothetical protein
MWIGTVKLRARARSPALDRVGAAPVKRVGAAPIDRVGVVLLVVFVLGAAFYVWTAGTSNPFTLDNGAVDRYNLLANAFLHFRLWIGQAPAGLVHLAEPFNPAQNAQYVDVGSTDAANLHDDLLSGGHLYFLWGPAPALVLLVPLHLLGLEPSASVTVACFGVAGLGFALAALRVLLKQVGGVPLWMCVLAACAVALGTTVPFLLRTPSVTEDTIAGGFCFTMAGVWLAAAAVANGGASAVRLVAMSLCFGLAAGSRPELGLAAVALVPVYRTLRSTHAHPPRQLLAALAVPVGVCFLLLAAYNQARFGDPLEFGIRHQLAGYDPLNAPFGRLSYLPPGVFLYGLSPPRLTAAFPFLVLGPPPLSYPLHLPANYAPEITGGLLATTPIVLFLLALPWIRWRRPTWLGALGSPLVVLAGTGVLSLLFLSYENYATTERYEVDFAGLVLFGALAAWLALAVHTRGVLRRLVRVGGAVLVVWGCATGFAVSFIGYGDFLAVEHHGTWNTLQDVGSPLSAVIARLAGRPVLAEVLTRYVAKYRPVSYTSLDTFAAEALWLEAADRVDVTIVSPDTRTAALSMGMTPGLERPNGGIGPGGGPVGAVVWSSTAVLGTYVAPPGGRLVRVPIHLSPGVNRFELRPLASTFTLPDQSNPRTTSLLLVSKLSLVGG